MNPNHVRESNRDVDATPISDANHVNHYASIGWLRPNILARAK